MYETIETRIGTVLILKKLVDDVRPLLEKFNKDIQRNKTEDSLHCWIVDMFSEDFEDEHGSYPQETLEKLALCIINAKSYMFHDKEKFCADFNEEGLSLKIGFDKTFYPSEIGHWYDRFEFCLGECKTQ